MRLDKFLKVTRLAKRRAEAKEALDAHRIELRRSHTTRFLKPSYEVKPGDELLIHFATRDVRVRVDAVPEKLGPKTKPESLYTILDVAIERQ
jgi:ribosomal 50S subunit-recycling heat shock protein